jgi:hypothetical protein
MFGLFLREVLLIKYCSGAQTLMVFFSLLAGDVMKKSIPILIGLLIVNATGAFAASTKDTASSPKQFVQSFYDWYVITKDRQPDVRGTEAALKQKKQLFDATLYQKLLEDEQASAKSPGEIVGLDFDPFVNANGLIYKKYQAGSAVMKGAMYRVPIYGIDGAKKIAKPVLEADVRKANASYVFTNFHFGKSDIPQNENLVSVLNELHKQREKPQK